MSKLLHHAIGVLFLPLMFACSPEKDAPRQSVLAQTQGSQDQLLVTLKPYERRSPLPKGPQPFRGEKLRALSPDAPDLRYAPYNFLGVMYVGGEPTVSAGTKNSIINLESLMNDKVVSRHLYDRFINNYGADRATFANVHEIERHIASLEQVAKRFGFDFLIFSFSDVDLYQRIFSGSHRRAYNVSWGRWDVFYLAHQLGMDTSLPALQRIASTHIEETFLYNIYNTPIGAFVEENGLYVIARYTTGAKFSAFYRAVTSSDIDEQRRVNLLGDVMNASLSWKGTSGMQAISDKGIGFSFGNGAFTANSIYKKKLDSLSETKCVLRVSGGEPLKLAHQAVDLKDINQIDMSPWVNSLENTKTHSIVQIDREGLVPITAFLLEENFKVRLSKELSGELPKRTLMAEPRMETRYAKWSITGENPDKIFNGIPYYDRNASAPLNILYTRFGDRIVFANRAWRDRCMKVGTSSYNGSEEAYTMMQETMKEGRKVFSDFDIAPNLNQLESLDDLGQNDITIVLPFDFSSGKVYKYLNPHTNMWYIYDREGKVALSFYDNYGDGYICDIYGFQEWFDNLPEKKLPMGSISSYRVIGI